MVGFPAKINKSNKYFPHNLHKILIFQSSEFSGFFLQESNIYKLLENYIQIFCSFCFSCIEQIPFLPTVMTGLTTKKRLSSNLECFE